MVVSKYSKVFLVLIIAFILFLFPIKGLAQTKQFVYDEANILSNKEINHLEEQAVKSAKKRGINFYILTTDGEHDIDIEEYMASFVDERLPEENVILVGIDLKHSDVMIMGFGKGKERLDNERATMVREEITPYLSDGEFYKAFNRFILTAENYVKYRPGVNPNNILLKTTWQLLFATLLGGIITFISVRNVAPKDTTTLATYQRDELTKVIRKKDRFIRRTVSKQYRPRNNNQGGRGGGGGMSSGGGRTSGGRSYSGSRGKF